MPTFQTRVAGIPCQCQVLSYTAPMPMRITGTGFGDADPPEHEDWEYRILDSGGRHAPWLEAKVTPDDEERLLAEYHHHEREYP